MERETGFEPQYTDELWDKSSKNNFKLSFLALVMYCRSSTDKCLMSAFVYSCKNGKVHRNKNLNYLRKQ